MRIILVLITILLIGFFGSWWWMTKDLIPLTDQARTEAPGQFASVSAGKLHYKWLGPENGEIVVMIHGFSTPHFIFAQNAEALAANGYRVLLYDHFGRGWSDRPKGPYTAKFYVTALEELLASQNITGSVHLVGLSMGGVIAPEYALGHPEKVKSVTLLVPAGLQTNGSTGLRANLIRSPILGDWLWTFFGKQAITAYDEPDIPEDRQLKGDLFRQTEFKGYFPALLSTLRNLKMSDNAALFQELAKLDVPVLAFYGTSDITVDIASAGQLESIMPNAKIIRVEGGDHGLNHNRYDEVNPVLLEFLDTISP